MLWLAKAATAAGKGHESAVEQFTQSVGKAAQQIQSSARDVLPPAAGGLKAAGLDTVDFALALAILAAAVALYVLVLWVLRRLLGGFVRRRQSELLTHTYVALRRLLGYSILLSGLFLGLSMLTLPTHPVDWHTVAWRGFSSLVLIAVAALTYSVLDLLLCMTGRTGGGLLDRHLAPLLRDLIKVALIIAVLVLIVQNWGYSPAALLAGVGLGGLAIAFAAQDTVANVFGSLVIFTDRPYRAGDWVQIGDVEGVVEEIGIRSTRIRKFDKSVASIPNRTVSGENVHNYSAMPKRRIKFTLRLDPQATPDKLTAALEAVRELVQGDERIEQGTWVVNLTAVQPAGADILVYCFTTVVVWQDYLGVQEELLLGVMRRLAELEVALAPPCLAAPP